MFEYSFHRKAEKELARLPIKIQKQVIAKIREICKLNHPLQHRKVIKLVEKNAKNFD